MERALSNNIVVSFTIPQKRVEIQYSDSEGKSLHVLKEQEVFKEQSI